MRGAFILLISSIVLLAGQSQAQPRYKPPVMRDDGPGVSIWFGHVIRTGQWCAFDRRTVRRGYEQNRLAPDESGWARYGAQGLTSVVFVQENEDYFTEDQYFVDGKGAVTKMIRTGHYAQDPLASLIFVPDPDGRLRLSSSSKRAVQRMKAADFGIEWVDWDHFSRLTQLPFVKLLDLKSAPKPGACQG
jgi:hypothetical protein